MDLCHITMVKVVTTPLKKLTYCCEKVIYFTDYFAMIETVTFSVQTGWQGLFCGLKS